MKEKRPVVLIVDDDEGMRDTLGAILSEQYSVIKVRDGESALETIAGQEVNVVLLDLLLPGIDGFEVLKTIKERYEEIEVIMITAVKDISTAVKAMKMGAYHYITKEFDYDEVLSLVGKIVEKQRDERELLYLRQEMEQLIETDFIVGKSKKIREIFDMVQKIARLPATVLILGESGTGKQLLARYIHKQSSLADRPFVTLDLAAVHENLIESTLFGHEKGAFTGAYRQHIGKFELAHNGTLFLDEIGHLRYELQGKLLRAIQDGEIERIGGTKVISVNARLIAATNVDLEKMVKKGEFREDLYFRINVIPIKVPPLRERREDIPQLVHFFMEKYSTRFKKKVTRITRSALDLLTQYHWPGNIRELENLVERIIAMTEGDTISQKDIPIEYQLPDPSLFEENENFYQKACDAFEKNLILKTLEKERWNRRRTAETLGIPLSTLKFRLRKLGLYEVISDRRKRGAPPPSEE